MSTLSMEQIYQLARNAGFPPDMATRMTAIAMKESGGNTNAYNGVGKDDSYGLWQINMIGNLGQQRLSQFGLNSKDQLLDPATNARAAYAIWNGNESNLNAAWAIGYGVNQQRYQQYLPAAQAAAQAVEMANVGGGGGNWTDTIATVDENGNVIPTFESGLFPGLDLGFSISSLSRSETALLVLGAGLVLIIVFATRRS